MATPFDLFKLTAAGIAYSAGFFDKDDEFLLSHIVPDEDGEDVLIVTNLTQFMSKREPSKPRMFNRSKFSTLFTYKKDEDGNSLSFTEPDIWLLPDFKLTNLYPKKKQRRDDAFDLIEPFTTPQKIYQYMAGKLNKEIKAHAEKLELNPNNNAKEIIRPLNRFVSLGCLKNALILVKYENCGQGPRTYKDGSKTGPKKKSCGNPTHSVSRMRNSDDIQKLREIAFDNGVERKDGKFQIKRIRTLFDREHSSVKGWVVKNGKKFPTLLIDEQQRLTKRQFYRVFHQAIMPNEMMILTDGVKEAINRSRQTKGKANEGVFRAGQVCEIDTTPLPVYLANPLNPNKRETVGKVYLCLIVCVATEEIMGYSLSFAPPIWENIAEALINCMLNKQEYASRYGVEIDPDDWAVQHPPEGLRGDNGVEYLKDIIQRIINGDELELNDFSINAPGQPKGKGTSEKLLDIIETFFENVQGKVTKGRNPSIQHPANHPIIFLDGLHALLIRAVVIHNTTHCRPRKITHEMASNRVKPTPAAMWNYLINHEAYGRPPTSPQQLSQKVWVLMRKHSATVNPREIRLNKLGYKNQWAIKQGWFNRAEFDGAFEIEVIAFAGSVDQIYVRDDVGVLHPIEIHDDYEKFRDMTLSQAQAEQHKDAQIKHDLEHQNAQALINYETEVQILVAKGEGFYRYAPVNCRISMPDGIDVLNLQMRENEQVERANRNLKLMGVTNNESKTKTEKSDTGTNEDEEFIC